MEARPIDANAVLQYIEETYCSGCNNYNGIRCRACNFDDAMSAVDDAPTLDYEPVRRGHYGFVGGSATSVYVTFGTCSECKERVAWYKHNKFCPNCGAKMDGGKKDDTGTA